MPKVISEKCRKERKKVKTQYKIREDGKKDTGRPTDMTPETINKLELAFSMGCTDLEACAFVDISKTTLYNFQAKNPDFVARKEILKEKLTLKARTVVYNALQNKDEATAKWYLERKRKDEFSTKQEVGGLMGIVTPEKPNLEEIRKLKDLLENDE